eukprot:TRINITY_DN12598_c0_g6_i1.p1 TRINITY_DN12598_c0_g6~~TRINITY_DN12598_c0_g6_i1.p1  ORF type:complete len:106 (+),score=10.80 TRINITY_DN12598_c0_g6_i1:213-530(+)
MFHYHTPMTMYLVKQLKRYSGRFQISTDTDSCKPSQMLTDSPASLSNDALVASIRAQGLIPEREPVEPLQAFADDFELPEDNIGEIQRAMQEISMTLKPPAWLLK